MKNYSKNLVDLDTKYFFPETLPNYFQNTNIIKVGLSASKNNVIRLIENPLKVIENTFYFILKAIFVLKIFKFLWRLFCHVGKNGLIRKISVTSKLMMSQPGLQTIAIHILPNISQSKNNQTIKCDQLIKYNKRNIFLQKLCGKWGRKTSSRSLLN